MTHPANKAPESRASREGAYFGKYRRRHRRCNSSAWIDSKTSADFMATRKEQRQHKLNQSFIKRIRRTA